MELKITLNGVQTSFEMEMRDEHPDLPVLFKCPEDALLYSYFGKRVSLEYTRRGESVVKTDVLCWWWCVETIDGVNYTSIMFEERRYR